MAFAAMACGVTARPRTEHTLRPATLPTSVGSLFF
jgi:hypothetical protein